MSESPSVNPSVKAEREIKKSLYVVAVVAFTCGILIGIILGRNAEVDIEAKELSKDKVLEVMGQCREDKSLMVEVFADNNKRWARQIEECKK